MHKLYWKIFLSFWLLTSFIVIVTMAITGSLTRQSSIPVSEKIFINSYANAAVATYESGHRKALEQWIKHISLSKHLNIFLLSSNGNIIGMGKIPENVKRLHREFLKNQIPEGIFRENNFIVSHEILTISQKTYRIVAEMHTPISHLIQIPWEGMSFVLTLAIILSGFVCYLLSFYLTKPLSSLRLAAKSIAKGKLETRVSDRIKNKNDEIAELAHEFDSMAQHIQLLIVSKERLVQDISHELRSPLARLQVAIAIAKKSKQENNDVIYTKMETEIATLNGLIGEILSLAKLLTSQSPLNIKDCRLDDVIQHIISDANFEFSNKKAKAVFKKEKIVIQADENIIYHAIENIIRNALRYTEPNTDVLVSLIKHDKSVSIEISDKGPGVPDNTLTKIFDPFLRVDTSREKSTGGYGLGLSIAKKAITLHEGTIFAENLSPNGLKVTISLPLG
jgi:two-component system sensor histidine kinase CpxA